mgnify:CR=1 FL=1
MKRTSEELLVCSEFSWHYMFFFFFYIFTVVFLPRHCVVGWLSVPTLAKNGLSDIKPLYGFNRKPFTHFGIISPEREPTWYVSFRLLIIQNGPIN